MARDDNQEGRAVDPAGESGDAPRPFVADRQRPEGPDDWETLVVENDLEAEFKSALDLNSWTAGERMDQLAERLEREVALAADNEHDMAPRLLETLQRVLPTAPDASREIRRLSTTARPCDRSAAQCLVQRQCRGLRRHPRHGLDPAGDGRPDRHLSHSVPRHRRQWLDRPPTLPPRHHAEERQRGRRGHRLSRAAGAAQEARPRPRRVWRRRPGP